jgi:hypothetical protein
MDCVPYLLVERGRSGGQATAVRCANFGGRFQIQGFTRLYHGQYPRASLHWEDRLSVQWGLQLVETTLNDADAESLAE